MDVHQRTILYYRVTTSSGRNFTSPTLDQAKAEAKGEEAFLTPIFAEAYQQAPLFPSPLPGVPMREIDPAQLIEVTCERLAAISG